MAGLWGAGCTFVATFEAPECGDGVADGTWYGDYDPDETLSEECDGADLRGRTCGEVTGFTAGTLGCTATCRYDTRRCYAQQDGRCDFEAGEGVETSPADCAFVKVVLGAEHTCALLADGAALCWGANDHGQLGTGRLDPETRPARVAGEIVFDDLWAGGRHTCGVDASGTAWCWGWNLRGQIGLGEVTEVFEPHALLSPSWVESGASSTHSTCFVTPDTGQVLCTGENDSGQLGTGSTSGPSYCEGAPCTREAVRVEEPYHATRVVVGNRSICAFEEDDDLWCWGWAAGGLLGTSTGDPTPLEPYLVDQPTAIEALWFGANFVCAKAGEGFSCWGDNQKGQLGDPTCTTYSCWEPRAVELPAGASVLAAGHEFACAIAAESNVYCWGDNLYGQLGRGAAGSPSSTPTAMPAFTNVERISAGGDHACVIKFDGTLWCWGSNSAGQLGDGAIHDGTGTPVQVIPGPAE